MLGGFLHFLGGGLFWGVVCFFGGGLLVWFWVGFFGGGVCFCILKFGLVCGFFHTIHETMRPNSCREKQTFLKTYKVT